MTPLFEAEFLLHQTTDSHQQNVTFTALTDGRFVAFFLSGDPGTSHCLSMRRFGGDGAPLAPEVSTVPAATTLEAPHVVALEAGGFARVYADSGVGGSDAKIRLQIFNRNGEPVGEEIEVNKGGLAGPAAARVTVLDDGTLLVTWTDYSAADTDTSGAAIRAQRYSADGVAIGGDFVVNEVFTDDQTRPDIVGLPGGGFIALWTDASAAGGDNDGTAIRARVFTADGTPKGGDILINTGTTGDQLNPRVVALQNGRIFIAWEDTSAGHSNLKGQIVNADGSVFGYELDLATEDGDQSQAAFAVLADGRIAMVYRDDDPGRGAGGEGADILLRILNDDGTFATAAIRVNDTVAGAQSQPALTVLPDGRVMIGWTDASLSPDDPSGNAVRGRIIDPRISAVSLSGTRGNDHMVGTAWSDLFDGSDGDDVINGRAGDDRIGGEDGADKLAGDDGNDRLWGGEGHDVLQGGRGSDVLEGGNGNDRLDGGLGEDILRGGAGNDVYVLDNLRDKVYESTLSSGGVDWIESQFLVINLFQYSGVENARLLQAGNGIAVGNNGANTLIANIGNDGLEGAEGNDRLFGLAGNDTLNGGAGNDYLYGGVGTDRLLGGAGRDRFIFTAAADVDIGASADVITDFVHRFDRLQFSAFMDGGRFIGGASFSGRADQVRYVRSTGMLYGDLNGDRIPDWHLRLQNKPLLDAFDFVF